MKKLIALSIITISANTFALTTYNSWKNPDGSVTTANNSNGVTATTRQNYDGSTSTVYSDGSTSQTTHNAWGDTTVSQGPSNFQAGNADGDEY